jgi:ATP-dependent helicase/nuclease subunit B
MDGVGFLPVEIAEALERGALIVTGNQRAARALRRGFDRRNRELGRSNWAPPKILSWDSWMQALWHGLVMEGHATQMLLNRMQEHAIWRLILERDKELASLQSVDSLAEMVAEAWQLLSRYQGRKRLRGSAEGSDAGAFLRWARIFEGTCETEGFLSVAQLEETLGGAAERGLLALPSTGVVLAGFDRMTPAEAGFVGAARSAGIKIEEVQTEVAPERRILIEAIDEREELVAAAHWVRKVLEDRPDAKIAVIVPNLGTERREIDQVFREVLAPELEDIRAPSDVGPYEFSLGAMLAETAMVATALDLLRWAVEALPMERTSKLLMSVDFSMIEDERSARAEFDAFELRKSLMLRPEISLTEVIAAIETSRRRGKLSRFLGTLRSMRLVANRLRKMSQSTNAMWAEGMRELLDAAGWSLRSDENSIQFQTRRKWESVLDELSTLDFNGIPVEYSQALEDVERIARKTMFAPASHDAPVQVMGALEAAGSAFDAIWFMRAGELSWPLESRSNGLLPWTLQRDLGMPGTEVTSDNEHTRRMTERIAGSAPVVVFSYASETEEGRQRPSPALAGLGLEKIHGTEFVSGIEAQEIITLEEIEDNAKLPFLPDRVIRGGAAVLQSQAACGFRAFAEYRLWASELESIDAGMDARESGTVVHDVLKRFWDEVKTQEQLRFMTMEERAETIKRCVNEALKKPGEMIATEWDEAYIEVQSDRLYRLLSWWLELELQRGMPFAVRLSEKEFRDVKVGPLRLNVRMDRVDEVEGGEVLIDYKTGAASPSDWLTERPDAPQLPLYAILSESRLKGVAFGLVRAGEGRSLKGYAVGNGILPGRPARSPEATTLEAQVERWRQVLISLAEEFYTGDARVQPKSYPKTCEYCAQRLICRLDVSSLEEVEQVDATAVDEVGRG